jgi:type I restriction enzyme S subunit
MSFPRYPKYKNSGVEWLGEVPEHWAVLPLKRIVSSPITDGPHETPAFLDEGVPFVSAEAVSAGRIDFAKVRGCISAEDNARYSLKYAPQQHDIYMVKSGATTGVTAIVEDRTDFNIWSPLAAIRCGQAAAPYFVLNFMRCRNFQEAVTLNWSYGTQQNIGMGVIENLPCVLPPLAEQTHIAFFLDRETAKIDALIAEQQRLIELLQEKRQAVISHAVTKGLNPDAPMKESGIEWLGEVPEHWKIGRCRFYVDMLSGFAFPSQGFTDDDADWRLLRGINVGVGSIRWDDTVYWRREPDDGLDSYEMRKGDLVIGMDRPLISDGMRVARLTEQDVPSLLLQRVVRLTPLPALDAEYLQHLLSSEMFVAHFAPETTGVSVPHISPDQIAAFVIPVPPIDEQRAIVSQAGKASAELAGLISEARHSIALLQERRSALISAAVTGQIDVRGLTGSEAA